MFKYIWHCRWCGHTYKPVKKTDRDGFCRPAHKQALHRARKKCVTAKPISPGPRGARAVTRRKKRS